MFIYVCLQTHDFLCDNEHSEIYFQYNITEGTEKVTYYFDKCLITAGDHLG